MTEGIPRSNVMALTNVYVRQAGTKLSADTSFTAAVRGKQTIHKLLRFGVAWTEAQRAEAAGIGRCQCGRNCFGRSKQNPDGSFEWGKVSCRCIRENGGVRPQGSRTPTPPSPPVRTPAPPAAPIPPNLSRETGEGQFWDHRIWITPSPKEREARVRRPRTWGKRMEGFIGGVALRLDGHWIFRGRLIQTPEASKRMRIPLNDLIEWYRIVRGKNPRDC